MTTWLQRDLDREYRPLSLPRPHPNRMTEQFAQAFDDREPQAQTLAPLAGGVVHLMDSSKIAFSSDGGMPIPVSQFMPPRLPRRKREGAADRRRRGLKCLDRRPRPACAR